MNPYELALYFWSAVVAVAALVPFAVSLVRSAVHGEHDASEEARPEPSLPSIPSWPSSPA